MSIGVVSSGDNNIVDPLLLEDRILAIIERGRRTTTYKLATLAALIDHCVERPPNCRSESAEIPIRELSLRVIDIYRPQVAPFEGYELAQSINPRKPAQIVEIVRSLRSSDATSCMKPESAMNQGPDVDVAVNRIARVLVQEPLPKLQNLPDTPSADRFLYDDTTLEHDGAIRLKPGIAYGLGQRAASLRLCVEQAWVDDIRRMNPDCPANPNDLHKHLFERHSRIC